MNRLTWLQKIVIQNPKDPEAWYWLGVEYEYDHNQVQAILSFTEGLKLASDQQKDRFLEKLSQAASVQKDSSSQINTHFNRNHDIDETLVKDTALSQENEITTINSKSKKHTPFSVIDGQGGDSSSKQEDHITFKDVAGLSNLKKTIEMKIISPFYNQGLFSKFRKKAGGGVLLYGPPGCGKTFMAKATAGECRARFYPIHITDVLDPYMGMSERNLSELFQKARMHKPSIIFIDELDTLGHDRSRSSSNHRGIIDTLLTQLEGIDTSTDQLLIIGATNMPWDVDSALKRPGRFDRLIFVAPPDQEAREELFRLKLRGRMIENIDFQTLAKRTEHYSGADIEYVCERAVEYVIEDILYRNVERPIRMQDIDQAMQTISPSTIEWLKTAKNFVRYANQSGMYNDIEDYLRVYGKQF